MNHRKLALAACLLAPFAASAQSSLVPGQFIAKMYTEVLGRAPDPSGWTNALPYFQQNGCSQNTLRLWGDSVFSSAEYPGLGYDHGSHVLVMYRAILDREPDPAGYAHWVSQLDAGAMTVPQLADSFFNSPEFIGLVPAICAGGSYSFAPNGNSLAMRVPTDPNGGGFDNLTRATLQAKIDDPANANKTIWLRQKSVVYLDSTLVLRHGVTLQTYGSPNTQHHALMARLVRAPDPVTHGVYGAPMVDVANTDTAHPAGLKRLWIDGQRGATNTYSPEARSVRVLGNAAVIDVNYFANTMGQASVQTAGHMDLGGATCASAVVTNNLVTSYSATATQNVQTDGIMVGCENATVTGNAVIDATDVGFPMFPAIGVPQHSIVRANTVISAGNNTIAAAGFDGYIDRNCGDINPGTGHPWNPCDTHLTQRDFTGAAVADNVFWSSPSTHFEIGIAVGSRAWFSGTGHDGKGATATGNNTAQIQTRVREGVGVSGMFGATVTGNTMNLNFNSSGGCPYGAVVASVSSGYASGTLQTPYVDTLIFGCI